MERTGGKPAPRAGSKTVGGGNPPIGVYPCKGGGPNDYVYIYTSAANPEHWTRLLKVMGREDLIGDARLPPRPPARNIGRRSTAIVSEWTIQHDKHTAMELVGSATIPAGAVLDTMELAERSHVPCTWHPADHEASGDRRLRHERLAGSLRRPSSRDRTRTAARGASANRFCPSGSAMMPPVSPT